MLRSSVSRWTVGAVAIIAVLGVLRFKPWQLFSGGPAGPAAAREQLKVGFLPVT